MGWLTLRLSFPTILKNVDNGAPCLAIRGDVDCPAKIEPQSCSSPMGCTPSRGSPSTKKGSVFPVTSPVAMGANPSSSSSSVVQALMLWIMSHLLGSTSSMLVTTFQSPESIRCSVLNFVLQVTWQYRLTYNEEPIWQLWRPSISLIILYGLSGVSSAPSKGTRSRRQPGPRLLSRNTCCQTLGNQCRKTPGQALFRIGRPALQPTGVW